MRDYSLLPYSDILWFYNHLPVVGKVYKAAGAAIATVLWKWAKIVGAAMSQIDKTPIDSPLRSTWRVYCTLSGMILWPLQPKEDSLKFIAYFDIGNIQGFQ